MQDKFKYLQKKRIVAAVGNLLAPDRQISGDQPQSLIRKLSPIYLQYISLIKQTYATNYFDIDVFNPIATNLYSSESIVKIHPVLDIKGGFLKFAYRTGKYSFTVGDPLSWLPLPVPCFVILASRISNTREASITKETFSFSNSLLWLAPLYLIFSTKLCVYH